MQVGTTLKNRNNIMSFIGVKNLFTFNVIFANILKLTQSRLEGALDIVVNTPVGQVKGLDYTTPTGCKMHVFESIPYAEPPRRFERYSYRVLSENLPHFDLE